MSSEFCCLGFGYMSCSSVGLCAGTIMVLLIQCILGWRACYCMGAMEQHTFQDFNQTMIDDQSVLWEADDEWHNCIANVGTPAVAAFPITLGSYEQGNVLCCLFVILSSGHFRLRLVIWHFEQWTPKWTMLGVMFFLLHCNSRCVPHV